MKLTIMNAWNVLALGIFLNSQLAGQELRRIPTLPQLLGEDTKKEADLTLADLEKIFRNHKAELFSEVPNVWKFGVLGNWCDALKKQPKAHDLQPMLLKEIGNQKAIDREPVGWDEIAVIGRGGDVGLLMECVIGISGEAGFNQVFESVVTEDNPAKLKILLLQVNRRGERAKYNSIVETRLKTLQSPRLKEVIAAYLKTATTGK